MNNLWFANYSVSQANRQSQMYWAWAIWKRVHTQQLATNDSRCFTEIWGFSKRSLLLSNFSSPQVPRGHIAFAPRSIALLNVGMTTVGTVSFRERLKLFMDYCNSMLRRWGSWEYRILAIVEHWNRFPDCNLTRNSKYDKDLNSLPDTLFTRIISGSGSSPRYLPTHIHILSSGSVPFHHLLYSHT